MRRRCGMKPAAFAILPKSKENVPLDMGALASPAHQGNSWCMGMPRESMFHVLVSFPHYLLIAPILDISPTFPFQSCLHQKAFAVKSLCSTPKRKSFVGKSQPKPSLWLLVEGKTGQDRDGVRGAMVAPCETPPSHVGTACG